MCRLVKGSILSPVLSTAHVYLTCKLGSDSKEKTCALVQEVLQRGTEEEPENAPPSLIHRSKVTAASLMEWARTSFLCIRSAAVPEDAKPKGSQTVDGCK